MEGDPFSAITTDMVVIVDKEDTDEGVKKLLERPEFVDETTVLHLRLKPVMVGSMMRLQRQLMEHKKSKRVVIVYLARGWVFSDEEDDFARLTEWVHAERGICLTRDYDRGTIKSKAYPCDAKGTICVDCNLSDAALVALACLSMNRWQSKDNFARGVLEILGAAYSIEAVLTKYNV